MDCRIIQDLLPLYVEKLASEESVKAVEEHLKSCPECMNKLEALTCEVPPLPQADREIQPLKRARRSLLLKLPAIILSIALVLTGVFLFVFWGVVPISSDRLSTEIEMHGSENDIVLWQEDSQHNKTGEVTIRTALNLIFIGKCSCMRASSSVHYDYNPDGTMTRHFEFTFYPILKLPFDDRGEQPNQEVIGLLPNKGDTLTIHCRDCELTYDLWELYQEYKAS